MSQAEALIQSYLQGEDSAEDFIEDIIEGDDLDEVDRAQRTFRRPKLRRFRGRGAAVDPVTGKRKDPRKRRMMRMLARKFKSARKRAAKKRGRQLKARGFFKKLGKLAARVRR
jgi:hypothetical protein